MTGQVSGDASPLKVASLTFSEVTFGRLFRQKPMLLFHFNELIKAAAPSGCLDPNSLSPGHTRTLTTHPGGRQTDTHRDAAAAVVIPGCRGEGCFYFQLYDSFYFYF